MQRLINILKGYLGSLTLALKLKSRSASRLEVSLICLVVFSLPLFEAPKNIFSVFFLATYLWNAIHSRSLGIGSFFDFPIFVLAAVLWVSPHFVDMPNVTVSITSGSRWTLLALFVLMAVRLDYSKSQITCIWSFLIVGGVVAVIESLYFWGQNGTWYPEFRSVGHVNHSSMYTLVTLAAGLGFIFSRQKYSVILGVLGIFSTLVFLPPSQSIVGAVSIFVILNIGIGLSVYSKFGLRGSLFSVFFAFLVVVAPLALPASSEFRQEFSARINGSDPFSGRDRIANSALVMWHYHPIIGTGWFTFGDVTSMENIQAALEEQGGIYYEESYKNVPHGHNLWITVLVERGLVGIFSITFLLFLYYKVFLPLVFAGGLLSFDRGVVVGALLVAVGFTVAGIGNTTMMNEHGHAGMALIAVSYGYLRGRGLLLTNPGDTC